ncbi:MAG: 1-acyl-sn-glycerol-3-phosphate acyltransferase [Campylobacterota bacterium]|nr:1-acyl-sn-glycerol-3-phosphate acyltransferase [Campylobacterota bacterium]
MGESDRNVLAEIEKQVLYLSPFIKEISVQKRDEEIIALIYPDFDALKKHQIINIESKIKWYAVELYNLDPIDGIKLDGYRIVQVPLATEKAGEEKEKVCINEPRGEVYGQIKSYLQGVASQAVFPTSHLELDLGLDSLDYVMLFVFIEKSFGVHIDEGIFADLMVMQDICDYVTENIQKLSISSVSWEELIYEPITYKLPYSPLAVTLFKTLFLPLFKLYFRLEISGKERLPKSPYVIAPSHQSMLDGFILAAALPYAVLKKSFFLAYKGEFGKWFMQPVSRHGQLIIIDANYGLKSVLQRSALPLKEGDNIVIFPEGARSRDGKLLPFKRFYAILAKELDVPIVPVLLDGTFEALKAGKLFPRPVKVRIEYLPSVYPEDSSHEQINAKVKTAIKEAMLKKPLR